MPRLWPLTTLPLTLIALSGCFGSGGTPATDAQITAAVNTFLGISDADDHGVIPSLIPTSGTATYNGVATVEAQIAPFFRNYYVGAATLEADFDGTGANITGTLSDFVVAEDAADIKQEITEFEDAFAAATTDAEREALVRDILGEALDVDGTVTLVATDQTNPLFITFTVDGALTHGDTTLTLGGSADGQLYDSATVVEINETTTLGDLTLTTDPTDDATLFGEIHVLARE